MQRMVLICVSSSIQFTEISHLKSLSPKTAEANKNDFHGTFFKMCINHLAYQRVLSEAASETIALNTTKYQLQIVKYSAVQGLWGSSDFFFILLVGQFFLLMLKIAKFLSGFLDVRIPLYPKLNPFLSHGGIKLFISLTSLYLLLLSLHPHIQSPTTILTLQYFLDHNTPVF